MSGIDALADSPFDFVIVDLSISGCGPSEPYEGRPPYDAAATTV